MNRISMMNSTTYSGASNANIDKTVHHAPLGIKTGFGSIAMYPAFDNPEVPGRKDETQKTKAISFRGWQYSHRTKYFNQKYIPIGYESEDDKELR